jgi:hypothetical protein
MPLGSFNTLKLSAMNWPTLEQPCKKLKKKAHTHQVCNENRDGEIFSVCFSLAYVFSKTVWFFFIFFFFFLLQINRLETRNNKKKMYNKTSFFIAIRSFVMECVIMCLLFDWRLFVFPRVLALHEVLKYLVKYCKQSMDLLEKLLILIIILFVCKQLFNKTKVQGIYWKIQLIKSDLMSKMKSSQSIFHYHIFHFPFSNFQA